MNVQPEDQRALEAEDGHTSVIYFHGIGNQRRFEETGRLIDSLERYCISKQDCAGAVSGTGDSEFQVRGFRTEISGIDEEEAVSFVDTRMQRQDGQSVGVESFRFYEVYWAPLASEEVPTVKVLSWLVKCAVQTVKAWIVCKWRSRPVIRKMALNIVRSTDSESAGINEQDAYLLEEAYSEFSRSEARMKYPKGSFKEFKAYLRNFDVFDIKGLLESAKRWKRTYQRMQLWNTFNLLTLFLFFFLLWAAIIWSAILLFPGLSSSIIQSVEGSLSFIRFSADLSTYNWVNGVFIGAGILLLFYLRYFLRKYVGDIQFWGTYEENPPLIG